MGVKGADCGSSILWGQGTGTRWIPAMVLLVASSQSPVLKGNQDRKIRSLVQPGSYPIRNHGMKWKLFTNTFLKVYYVPDTLQGSRLVGERKGLHRNRLGYSKRSQGDCMSREEGVSHCAGEPRKALQRDDAWARSWKADLPERRWRSPQKEWWGGGPQRRALQTSLTELQSCQDFE